MDVTVGPKTGVAYIALTLTTIAFSAVAQGLVTKFGVRIVLPVGLALVTVALVLFAQLPVHGHYFRDLFPAFIVSGLGLAFAFVPMSIGALTGVRAADAGVATQQIGGRSASRPRRRSRPAMCTPTSGPLPSAGRRSRTASRSRSTSSPPPPPWVPASPHC